MNLERLYTAVELVRSACYRDNSRETTLVRTYPVLLSAARAPAKNAMEAFLRAACLAYSWMPQEVRLDQTHLASAAAAFSAALDDEVVVDERIVDPIAACLSSVIGASKILHLANPGVFPIWDEQIERFRLSDEPTPYHMGQARHYLAFIQEIRALSTHSLFLTFHHDYCTAYQERLQRLRIPPYPLTEPRVVESAIRELSGE
jgi:hypothetical protein